MRNKSLDPRKLINSKESRIVCIIIPPLSIKIDEDLRLGQIEKKSRLKLQPPYMMMRAILYNVAQHSAAEIINVLALS